VTEHQPLTHKQVRRVTCPHCCEFMEPFTHYCEACKERVAVADDVWNGHALDDVRSAVEGLRADLQKTRFNGAVGSSSHERKRLNYLVDKWFPVLAEEVRS